MPRSTPILKLLSQSAAIWRPASDRGPHSESLRSWCRVFLSAMLLAAATFSAPYVGAVQAQASAVSFCNGDRSVNSYGFSLDENTESNTVVGTVAACKPHSDSLTYSVGGTDVAKFNNVFDLNASTGEITVKSGASPNYEAYNSYSLTVTVTDAEDSSEATVPMSITVRNVDEPGIVTLSTSSPQVGVQVRASLYDPDGLIGGVFRSMWSRANVATGPFFLTRDEFERNNRNLYFTPNVDNRYRYLKFTIYYLDQTCPDVYSHSYVDRHGQPCLKKAEVVSESVVANADGLIIQRQSTNTPATGNVRITFYGEIRVGRSLHGDVLNAQDEDGTQSLRGHLTKFSWQWFRIDPRTLAEERVRHPEHPTWNWTYVVQDADRGKGIQARVSFLDDSGNTETLRSEIQLIPAPPNNAATGSPVITGTAQVGETLTADTDDLQDTDGIVTSTLTYQWFANDGTENTATERATSSTYTLVTDDEGKTITVQVAFSDEFGYTEALTSAPTASVAPRDTRSQRSQQQNGPGITGTAPTIKGSPALSDSGSDYEWTPGETVQVTLTFSEEVNVDTTDGTPSIGIQLGGTLDHNASYASGSGTTKLVFSYTLADDDGRHSSMFVPGDSLTLNGGTITSASSGGDAALGHTGAARSSFAVAAVPNSAATGEPTISGTAQVGQMLTASTSDISDSDGLINATFTYQWIANDGTEDTDIQDATGSTYTLAAADEGKTIKVRVSFTDDGGNQETRTSAVTVAVAAVPNSAATGEPTISGTAQVGQMLTASTSDISDSDGLINATFTYQWIANDGTEDTDIQDATGFYLHSGGRRRRQDHQGAGELHRRRGEPGDAYERRYRSSGCRTQQRRDRRADDQRDGAGRTDADRINIGHIRQRRADQCHLHLPVDSKRWDRRHGYPGRDRFYLHSGGRRRRQDHQGAGELHRRRGEPGDAYERRYRSSGCRALPADSERRKRPDIPRRQRLVPHQDRLQRGTQIGVQLHHDARPRLHGDRRLGNRRAKVGQRQEPPMGDNRAAVRERRCYRGTPGHHQLRRAGSHLRRRRQEAVQPAHAYG